MTDTVLTVEDIPRSFVFNICTQWTSDARLCGRADATVRRYVIGHRCDEHSPAAQAGRVAPTPDLALTVTGLRAAAANRTIIDMPGHPRVVL